MYQFKVAMPESPVQVEHHVFPYESDEQTRERTFVCPEEDCGRRFHRKFTLREHLKTHTGEKPYQCAIPTCAKRFSTSGNLARHRRLHTLKKLECPIPTCTRIFTKQEKLTRHLKVHMGSAAYACPLEDCAKTFSTSGNLSRHMRTQHRVERKDFRANGSAQAEKKNVCQTASSPVEVHQHFHAGYPGANMWLPGSTFTAGASDRVIDHDMMDVLHCLFPEDEPHATGFVDALEHAQYSQHMQYNAAPFTPSHFAAQMPLEEPFVVMHF
ncbi:Zinc finger protein, partial [Globisporangium splendens]